ncbi:MAG: peptidylprolyl isomerase [Candidatus Promineifilaceae bacterium]
MSNTLVVADGIVVGMDYTLHTDDGQLIDSSEGEKPLAFLQGQGHIIPGLEQALYGMREGESKKVVVEPADAYGELDPDAFHKVPMEIFPEDLSLQVGMGLHLRDTNTGQPLQAFISEIMEDGVLLDFNHPLAGETLHFEVTIAYLREATEEEKAHGHVHDGSHQH